MKALLVSENVDTVYEWPCLAIKVGGRDRPR